MSEHTGFEPTDEFGDEFGEGIDGDLGDPAADLDSGDSTDVVDEPAAEVVVATGHPAVDEVLRSLESLGDLPADEHVPVFEQAHDQLRRTLSGAGDDQD